MSLCFKEASIHFLQYNLSLFFLYHVSIVSLVIPLQWQYTKLSRTHWHESDSIPLQWLIILRMRHATTVVNYLENEA